MIETTCPKCRFSFNVSDNRTYEGIGHDIKKQIQGVHKAPEILVDASSQVKCPKCGEVFISQGVRYLGFLSPAGMKIFIGLFVFCFLVAALITLFKSI